MCGFHADGMPSELPASSSSQSDVTDHMMRSACQPLSRTAGNGASVLSSASRDSIKSFNRFLGAQLTKLQAAGHAEGAVAPRVDGAKRAGARRVRGAQAIVAQLAEDDPAHTGAWLAQISGVNTVVHASHASIETSIWRWVQSTEQQEHVMSSSLLAASTSKTSSPAHASIKPTGHTLYSPHSFCMLTRIAASGQSCKADGHRCRRMAC